MFIINGNIKGKTPSDSVFFHLDKVLENKENYVAAKEQKIQNLKQMLTIGNLSPIQRYDIYLRLYEEYKKYIADSAVYYIRRNVDIANLLQDIERRNESEILLSWAYSTKGMYIESKSILENIDYKELSPHLLSVYYDTYSEFYSHYGQSNANNIYYQKSEDYRDLLLSVLNPESLQYQIEYATKLLYKRNLKEAENLLLGLLDKTSDSDSERALISYLLGQVYKQRNQINLQRKYFTISAITDIQNCIKDNASQQSLALTYYESGDIDRAYKFIQSAIDDAVFCNVRYRTIEASSYYPIINASYRDKEQKQKDQLLINLILISILSAALIVGIIYIYIQVKRLARIRKELYRTNKELNRLNSDLQMLNVNLQESNHIKEEYIGHFFDLCSTYIDKLENYRKELNKKASKNQIEDLFRMIKSTTIVENEIEELYKNFDIIFLNIYPTFVEEFNDLLNPEERITPKQGELLNTELRIFALIRLGIKDSVKIASFLRYSLRTVYNYRTKMRNKSAVPRDRFEEYVEKIGSFQSYKNKN